MLGGDWVSQICSMIQRPSPRCFCVLLVFLIALFAQSANGHAQLSFQPKDVVTSSRDSLDLMTQMWHALPEAEVGGIALAGGASDASEVPGSMQRLSSKTLRKMSYADPIRTLHALAGVNVVAEDGFGLRPNVGMRGSGTERSSRITLMEDGVLMAPAPYSAPSAYYFPTIARMESVEVRKGGSQIAFGPQTAGGALNLVSSAIPDQEIAGRVRFESGSFQNQQMHAVVGGTQGQWGYNLEFMQLSSDGFKDLDTGEDTGFEKTDVVAKLQWTSTSGKHKLRFKGAQSGESSRETYLGLAAQDFASNPFRRYAASAKDLMLTDHAHVILGHEFKLTARWSMTTEMYQTWFARNWYKLDRVVDSTGTKLALGDILTDESMVEALGWLRGATTVSGAGLDVKANNRHYGARGIQHRGRWSFGGSQQHRLTYGVRAHEDFMDRYQWRDRYAMVDGQMALVAAGDSGSAGNRIESARALAGHVRAAFHVGSWTFTPGVRHERMALSRQDFGEDLARLGSGSERTNDLSVWLPGVGAHVDLVPNLWTAFAGVHRGFVPPGSSPDTEPEFSNHLEVGTRLSSRMVSGQLTLFHSEHQNLLGSDLTASGGTGSGDLFNGGASRAQGIEVEAVGDVLELTGASAFFADDEHHFPVRASYTYTQAVFTQSFESEFDPWGMVEEGDALPYLAPHQFSLAASWEAPQWSYDLNLRGMSAMRTTASQGAVDPNQSTDAMAVLDMGIRHQAHGHLEWFAGITNVFNDTYVVARRPYGLRPGMPRAFRAGATVTF